MLYNKNALYIQFVDEPTKTECIVNPVYICRNKRNNVIISCDEVKATGVVSSDESSHYQLEGRAIMDTTYRVVRKITYAEFSELQDTVTEDDYDPELSDEEALNIIMNGI